MNDVDRHISTPILSYISHAYCNHNLPINNAKREYVTKKKFFSFAIKFKKFTLGEVTIPAHILGNFTPIIREFCKFYKVFLYYYVIYGIFLLKLTK